ncbi:MAG: TIGR03960 family B12-binding radical SAM protein [Deltaproteobacteria bacterium]|nr:TIGR03960 family B12-binding radical SAM protein [Deltaproteobacteria bacterium]
MKHLPIDNILSHVEKPSRYIGGEVNSIRKNRASCTLTVALAFPDVYEVGMSHLGIQILYSILNGHPDIAAERFFAPWPDMEVLMRRAGIPLSSCESRTPLNRFDIVGFSLQYELSYTNVLTMLDLGGIHLYAEDRDDNSPIVIAGGPCVFNPEPVSPFFDAFVIGEGEEVIVELSRAVMEAKQRRCRRRDMLASVAAIEGVYVPSIHTGEEAIKKRIVADINQWKLPLKPIVSVMKTIHDRVTLEITRGCSRGCRFCQAGMVWRPTRERTPDILEDMADSMLASTGHNELSLLSLSSGDYSCIEYLMTSLMNTYYDEKIALALPSMRVETLTKKLIEQIKRVRKTSFTLAPEAGTQRLRNVINKGNTEENLLMTTRYVFDAGWKAVKLYFMLGLPTERHDDLKGIADLAYKVLHEGGKKRQVTVSLSTFVPKPHTPFQWERQIGLEEIHEKQEFFKNTIRHRNLNLKWHDGKMSLLEGVFSRGDNSLATVIAKAFSLGCRFDGWSDQLKFNLWEQAFRESNISVENFLRERDSKENLPWDRIDCGINKDFLIREYQKSLQQELTEDCRSGPCHNCGVCNNTVKIILAKDRQHADVVNDRKKAQKGDSTAEEKKYRFMFAKQDGARLLSHLETSKAMIQGITMSGLRFAFSKGFHPHPKISFAFATPVGIESNCEYVDAVIKRPIQNIQGYIERINASLPSGLEITNIEELTSTAESLVKTITGYHYSMYLPKEVTNSGQNNLEARIQDFLAMEDFTIIRKKKGKAIEKNIRPFVNTLTFNRMNYSIDMSLHFGSDGGANPWEILKNVIGLDDETVKSTKVIKTAPILSNRKD